MEKAKRRLLSEISRQFQHDYAEATAQLGSKSDELETRVEKVQHLHTLYQMTDASPVWPFDTATLRRFVVAVTVPLVPEMIELAVTIGSALLRSA